MRAPVLAVLSLALMAGPALAQPRVSTIGSGEPTAPRVKVDGGDPDRRICRSTPVTGSRLGKRKTCRTAREWAAMDVASSQAVRDLQRPGGHNGGVHATPRGPGNISGSRGGGG